jgi:hypothetical protein
LLQAFHLFRTPGEIVSGPAYAVRTSLALLGTANTYGVGVLRERCSLVELPIPWFVADQRLINDT